MEIRKAILVTMASAMLLCSMQAVSQSQIETGTEIPQIQPIRQFLKAVETGDVELLLDCYTERIRTEVLSEVGKEGLVKIYREAYAQDNFYPFKADDLQLVFEWHRDSTTVGYVYYYRKDKPKEKGYKRVDLENGKWKMGEK